MIPSAIHIENSLCRDCQICTLACSLIHDGSSHPALARLKIRKDMAAYRFEIVICRHCETPDCLPTCPSEALQLDECGVVRLIDENCQSCGLCAEACPYGAIFYHAASGRYLKCDLCAGRAEGPLCVELCPVEALTLDAKRRDALSPGGKAASSDSKCVAPGGERGNR
jgi:Fe-S-cluster-containing hydrogenase component 2